MTQKRTRRSAQFKFEALALRHIDWMVRRPFLVNFASFFINHRICQNQEKILPQGRQITIP